MMAYDFEKDVFDFPLPVNLNGGELWLMVRVVVFTGGMFYTVRGEGLETLHILRSFDDEQQGGKSHFTVLNGDTSADAIITAILDALLEPPDNGELPDEEV